MDVKYGTKIESEGEIKEILLDLLLSFHRFCEEHDIHYSLDYGTLLGAIRHKGFIPWDDDIDVCMLRADYEKLEHEFPKDKESNYSFFTLNREKKWNRPYGKFVNTKTIEIEDVNNNVGVGLGIDIFPIDDAPDDVLVFESFRKRRLLLVQASTIKGLVWSKGRSLIKNIIVIISHFLLLPFSNRFLAKTIDRYIQKNNGKSFSYVYHSCDAVKSKMRYPKSFFCDYVDVPFEGYSFRVIVEYDKYLTQIYGNYMQLPPEEKRVSHHAFEAFWK